MIYLSPNKFAKALDFFGRIASYNYIFNNIYFSLVIITIGGGWYKKATLSSLYHISDLCNQANKNKYDQVFNGNFDPCFNVSANLAIRAFATDELLQKFIDRWHNILKTDVSFAVRVLPNHRIGSLQQKGIMDFDNEPSLKRGFNIPIL